MPDFGGPESLSPDEGAGGVSEQLSEEAKQRFRAAQAAIKKIRDEEKRAKKRDDHVARAIIQFLGEEEYAHLFQLIAHLVAHDCPSIFILAILSLVSEPARAAVDEYLGEHGKVIGDIDQTLLTVSQEHGITKAMNVELLEWMHRLQMVMDTDAKTILTRLLIDEKNIDGTALQVTTFVVVDFFSRHGKKLPFEDTQALSISILQAIFEPFLHHVDRKSIGETKWHQPTDEMENP